MRVFNFDALRHSSTDSDSRFVYLDQQRTAMSFLKKGNLFTNTQAEIDDPAGATLALTTPFSFSSGKDLFGDLYDLTFVTFV